LAVASTRQAWHDRCPEDATTMPALPRRTGLLTAAATLALPAVHRAPRAAEYAWRIGHTAPTVFPLHNRMVEAAKEVAEKTDGRITIEVVGDGQLGGGMGQLAQLRAGTLEMAPISGQVLTTVQAAIALPMTGFAWSGYPAVWQAMDGEFGRVLRELLIQRSALVTLDTVWDFGFRILTTGDKAVTTPDDLRGLRVRTPVEPEFVSLFQALQASPIAMPLPEVYRALAQRHIDGQEGLLALVPAVGLQTVQKHCILTNHMWDGHWLCVSPAAWRRLPDALKAVVATAFNAAGKRQRADHAAADGQTRTTLEAGGMTFHTIDPAPFRARLREVGFYRDLKRKFGDPLWNALEQSAGRMA
jgi:tripartite ATP-independent transporter DctP family solute receptor